MIGVAADERSVWFAHFPIPECPEHDAMNSWVREK